MPQPPPSPPESNPSERPSPASAPHVSVLLEESLELLELKPGACAIDGTLGAGGHSAAIIQAIKPGGRLIGLDVDPDALDLACKRLEPLAASASVELNLVKANFRRIASVLDETQAPAPQGILLDLGVSSMQFDRPERGFSFRFDQPLDMRMDPQLPRTAADILRETPESELADLFFHLGEERKSRRIAAAIVAQRKKEPLRTTGQLAELVARVLRVPGHWRIHPATRVFQALRLAVNEELSALEEFLDAAPERLAPGGTLAIITFHSLEDRIVKHRFKALAASGRFQQLVKFVEPAEAEVEANPRSRSAKLRAIRRVCSLSPCGRGPT